jgi:uncharacterized protein (DUF433 family)
MAVEVKYKYLITRPGKWKKQLYIKGRGCLTARHVVGTMVANHLTPEETAEGYGLPVEAVLEAWEYYQENKTLVDAEVGEEVAGVDLNRTQP